MDLGFVYFQDNHVLVHKWLALSNPESENFEEITGHLKLGICVQAEGDEDFDLSVKEKEEAKDSEILMPPQVTRKSVQLTVTVVQAEGLPKMDGWNGTLDAYCSAEFAGASVSTSDKEADSLKFSAQWLEALYIPVSVPPVTSRLRVRVWDKDILADELVGSMNFEWNDIVDGKYSELFWTCIYGAPREKDNAEAEKMNLNPTMASHYRGRLLMKITVDAPQKPKLECVQLNDDEFFEYITKTFGPVTPYELRAQVYSGSALSPQHSEYSLCVSWCGKGDQTKPQPASTGTCHWFQGLKRKIVKLPSSAELALPDVFVYLLHGSDKVCYARFSAYDWMDLHAGPRWIPMTPDKAVGEVDNVWEGGYARVRIYIGAVSEANERLALGKWNLPPRMKRGEPLTLIANIYQCRNLPAADSDGNSDPYVKVHCYGYEVESEVKDNTLNPMWYTPLALEIPNLTVQDNPPIVVYVFDKDVFTSHDLLGMVHAQLALAEASEVPQEPQWKKLLLGKLDSGEILISFNILKQGSTVPYSLVPKCTDVVVEINSLGLRDLQPALGWVPINKPFIKFDLNSLQIPGEHLSVRNVETQPMESGANPNISTIVKFECKMPLDPLFSPVLTATVYDYLFRGLAQPQLGTFNIELGKYLHKFKSKHKGALGFMFTAEGENTDLLDIKQSEGPGVKISLEEARNGGFVVLPTYEKGRMGQSVVKFKPAPPFAEIGYDREEGDNILHYRYTLNTELEDTEYIDKSPFEKFTIFRGQERGADDNWVFALFADQDNAGNATTLKTVGEFKGLVRVTDQKKFARKAAKAVERRELNKGLLTEVLGNKRKVGAADFAGVNHSDSLLEDDEDESFEDIKRMILAKTSVIVRVYVLEAQNLPQRDWSGHSDPYIVLKLGDHTINDSDNYIADEPNPKFYRSFDLKTTLPGPSLLKIQLWDKDLLVKDDKIGQTVLDLEDRYFSTKWQKLPEKPIETRSLYLTHSKMVQGSVRLWLELIDPGHAAPPRDISPRPPAQFEARLIVWKTKGVANYDVEATSDIYVRAWVTGAEPKETDTHFRCQNGRAHFNWRMRFPLALPNDNCYCNIQLWDRDILSSSDFIGDLSFAFGKLARTAFEQQVRIKKASGNDSEDLERVKDEKYWVTCKRRKEDGSFEDAGEIQMSFEVIPKTAADALPVGEGRDEPNLDPYLPPPLGRFKWTWNPCTLISQSCGPEFRCKICCAICCVLCVYLCVLMGPMLFSSFVAGLAS